MSSLAVVAHALYTMHGSCLSKGTSYSSLGLVPSPLLLLLLLQDKMTKNVERELMNHSKLIHPHIVRFYECFLTEKHLAIVMEYAAGGSLYSHVTAK